MLACLGLFVFNLQTAPFSQRQRSTTWRHARSAPIGERSSSQFIGPGEDTITLTGTIAPDVAGNLFSLDALRIMGDTGEPYMLILGNGQIVGAFEINNIDETSENLHQNGTARQTGFSISLTRTPNDTIDALALITSPLSLLA
jgi:phage protein U